MIAFSTDDLARIFRAEVADEIVLHPPSDADRLWKDHEVYQYLTEAADKVAKKVEGWYQTLTIPLAPLVESQPPEPVYYPLPRGLLHIREAKLARLGRYLEPANADDHIQRPLGDYGYLWRRDSARMTYGIPREYIRDYAQNALLLRPLCTVGDTLELQCTMTIGAPLGPGLPLPFLDVEDQRLMLHYMKKCAYEKHDPDTLNLQIAQQYEQQFESSALNRRTRLRSYRRRPGLVRMDW